MKRLTTIVLGVAALALGTPAAAQGASPAAPNPPEGAKAPVAQPSGPTTVVPRAEETRERDARTRVTIEGQGSHAFRADLDTAGDASVSRAGATVALDLPMGDKATLSLNLTGEASWYDFSGATGIIPGATDPWNTLYSVAFDPRALFFVDEHWSWFIGGEVRAAGEGGADVGEALTFGGTAGARYAFSKKFALTFGVFGTSRLEDDALVLPLIGVEWQINDKVRFATRGTGGALTATVAEGWDLSLLAAWSSRGYRLEDGRALLPEGVVRDTRVPVGVEIAWSPSRSVRVALSGGVVAWQEYETLDSAGNEISTENTDAAPWVGLAAVVRF